MIEDRHAVRERKENLHGESLKTEKRIAEVQINTIVRSSAGISAQGTRDWSS